MKFFAMMLLVCPLIAQIGRPVSNVADTDTLAAPPPEVLSNSPAYLAKPDAGNGNSDAKSDGQRLYRWSLAAVAAGNAADTFSSWHQPEANPLLASPGSEFDGRSVLVKSALVGASLLVEHWALRQNPHLYRTFAWLNFTIAGVLGGVVAHNIALR
jgi:hypothetical protein